MFSREGGARGRSAPTARIQRLRLVQPALTAHGIPWGPAGSLSNLLPSFHYPDGRHVIGWPGTWQHAISRLPVNLPDSTGFRRFLSRGVENARDFALRGDGKWKTSERGFARAVAA